MRRQLLLQRVLAGWLAALLLVAGLWIPAQRAPSVRAAPSNDLKYDYAEVLGKSLLFYEAQRAGPRDPRYTWRVDWRQPAALNDGQDVGGDLAGGWFDAGDHVKFGLPMAASATLLAWGYYEAPGAYAASGQKPYLLDNLRFVLDYFLNAYQEGAPETATDDIFHYQVGDPGPDHAFWGPPEKMTMPRPTYSCTASAPCSEVTAGTAAALAAGALVFATGEPAYAATLRGKAERLYRFADTYRSGSGYRAANGFYTSFSGYWDELAWGATWLYLLTGDSHYLDTARETIAKAQDAASWAHNWDNASIGTYLLLARITGDPAYRQVMERHLDYWADTLTRTPGGLRFLNQWGSLRYASTTAFLALVYAGQTSDAGRVAKYRSFALSQINYILGDNPRNSSYVVGFGNNPPKNPHHRAAHDSPTFSINAPAVNRHELTGALVGGPASADDFDWRDDRSDYIRNEVATDYNAGFTGALAEILELASDGYTPPAPTATPPAAPTATLPPSPASPTPGATPVTAELAARLASQSNWGTGYCADVAVQNTTGNAVAWSTRVPVEGRLTQIWSASGAVAGGYLTVRGLDWNGVLQPGAGTTFGFCADRDPAATPTQPPATPTAAPVSPTSMPSGPPAQPTNTPVSTPPAQPTATPAPAEPTAMPAPPSPGTDLPATVIVQSDWGGGYCANVRVTNPTAEAVTWTVRVPFEGAIREVWNAEWSAAGGHLTASGVAWNKVISPGGQTTFGFCAIRSAQIAETPGPTPASPTATPPAGSEWQMFLPALGRGALGGW